MGILNSPIQKTNPKNRRRSAGGLAFQRSENPDQLGQQRIGRVPAVQDIGKFAGAGFFHRERDQCAGIKLMADRAFRDERHTKALPRKFGIGGVGVAFDLA